MGNRMTMTAFKRDRFKCDFDAFFDKSRRYQRIIIYVMGILESLVVSDVYSNQV